MALGLFLIDVDDPARLGRRMTPVGTPPVLQPVFTYSSPSFRIDFVSEDLWLPYLAQRAKTPATTVPATEPEKNRGSPSANHAGHC